MLARAVVSDANRRPRPARNAPLHPGSERIRSKTPAYRQSRGRMPPRSADPSRGPGHAAWASHSSTGFDHLHHQRHATPFHQNRSRPCRSGVDAHCPENSPANTPSIVEARNSLPRRSCRRPDVALAVSSLPCPSSCSAVDRLQARTWIARSSDLDEPRACPLLDRVPTSCTSCSGDHLLRRPTKPVRGTRSPQAVDACLRQPNSYPSTSARTSPASCPSTRGQR